ncbi:hypothetical protein FCV25MIE_05365 [Fagus crenata]
MDNLEPTSGNDMHREEDVRDTTPSSPENPRAPMDTHDLVISPIEHWTPAQEPPMASTQRRQNMSMQEALFNAELNRIDEALGLGAIEREQPHTTIEKITQLTSVMENKQREQSEPSGYTTTTSNVSHASDQRINITEYTAEPIIPLYDESSTTGGHTTPVLEEISVVVVPPKSSNWKKRARNASSPPSALTTTTHLEEQTAGPYDVAESGDEIEEPSARLVVSIILKGSVSRLYGCKRKVAKKLCKKLGNNLNQVTYCIRLASELKHVEWLCNDGAEQ